MNRKTVNGSDSAENAQAEIRFFFEPQEIVSR